MFYSVSRIVSGTELASITGNQMDRWVGGWWVEGWMHGWMNEWLNEWMKRMVTVPVSSLPLILNLSHSGLRSDDQILTEILNEILIMGWTPLMRDLADSGCRQSCVGAQVRRCGMEWKVRRHSPSLCITLSVPLAFWEIVALVASKKPWQGFCSFRSSQWCWQVEAGEGGGT